MKTLNVYGGSFDPWHEGHAAISSWLASHSPNQTIIVPTLNPIHKARELGAFDQRMQSIEQWVDANIASNKVVVSDIEKKHAIAGRTQVLLRALSLEYPAKVTLVVGQDSFAALPQWHNANQWTSLVDWLIFPRVNCQAITTTTVATSLQEKIDAVQESTSENSHDVAAQWHVNTQTITLANMPCVPISSTQVRNYD